MERHKRYGKTGFTVFGREPRFVTSLKAYLRAVFGIQATTICYVQKQNNGLLCVEVSKFC